MGKVMIVPSCVDTGLFRPAAHKWPELVMAVGRLAPEKNFSALLAAVATIPWTRLWIAGDGPLHVELAAQVDAIGDSRIVLLGNIPNDRVADLLARSEYFVLPSLYDQAPKSLWEAMSAGCLCIVSAKVGVVEDGATGYLCNPDPSGIRAALERARVDPGRERIRASARKHVLAAQVGSGLATEAEKVG